MKSKIRWYPVSDVLPTAAGRYLVAWTIYDDTSDQEIDRGVTVWLYDREKGFVGSLPMADNQTCIRDMWAFMPDYPV